MAAPDPDFVFQSRKDGAIGYAQIRSVKGLTKNELDWRTGPNPGYRKIIYQAVGR